MEIKVINKSAFSLPNYETQGSAGMDIKANIPSAVTLSPMERCLIPTGLFIEIPQGFECQIRPRSGLALKKGIGILNSPGTIDSDYRGEIGVILVNLSAEIFFAPNTR
jgi:dUTP pyrophosphatase